MFEDGTRPNFGVFLDLAHPFLTEVDFSLKKVIPRPQMQTPWPCMAASAKTWKKDDRCLYTEYKDTCSLFTTVGQWTLTISKSFSSSEGLRILGFWKKSQSSQYLFFRVYVLIVYIYFRILISNKSKNPSINISKTKLDFFQVFFFKEEKLIPLLSHNILNNI